MKRHIFFLVVLSFFFIEGNKNIFPQQETTPEIKVETHGDVQFDGRFYSEETSSSVNTFYIRRGRIQIEGSFLKDFSFRFMPNFAGSRLDLQDAFVEFKIFSFARVRGGKFKSPLGLERLQSPTNYTLIELGLPTNLVPNRDVGFTLTGTLSDGEVNYSVGIFNGVIDGENSEGDNTNDKDFVGRIFLNPFKSTEIAPLQGLGIGLAASTEIQKGIVTVPLLPVYRTSGRQAFFSFLSNGRDSGTVIANGKHRRLAPQAYYYFDRFGLLTEYVITEQKVKILNSESNLSNNAWQVAVSFLLTDDKASYNEVKPKNNFDPAQGNWGAFEVAFRYNELSIDKDAFPIFSNPGRSATKAKAWAAGFNWYFNQYFRFSINYESTSFEGSSSNFTFPDENIILTRLQVVF